MSITAVSYTGLTEALVWYTSSLLQILSQLHLNANKRKIYLEHFGISPWEFLQTDEHVSHTFITVYNMPHYRPVIRNVWRNGSYLCSAFVVVPFQDEFLNSPRWIKR